MKEVEKMLQVLELIHWQYLSVSKVLQAMILGVPEDSPHHRFFVHLPREAQRMGQKLASEGVDLDILTEWVLQEAWRRMEAPLSALWEALGMHPRTEVEEALRKGYWLRAGCYRSSWRQPGRVQVEVTGKTATFYHEVSNYWCPEFSLEAWGGRIEVSTPLGLFLRQNRAFLYAPGFKRVKEALRWAKNLRPFLSALGLEDLEKALLALTKLRNGDIRMEGPYLLARKENLRVLRRGLLLENPALDGAFLTGQGVGLFYPKGLGITFRSEFVGNQIGLRDLKVWWRWESAHIGSVSGWSWNVLEDNFLGELIGHGLAWGRQVLNVEGYPTKLRVLIESLSESLDESENPLILLNSNDLHSKIALHLLSWF
jgi:hypothetical protein